VREAGLLDFLGKGKKKKKKKQNHHNRIAERSDLKDAGE
jgi:hypothetical protein